MFKQSRTTKVALASILATSALVPAIAASADSSQALQDGTYTIDFAVTDTTKHLANYVKGPATLVVKDGKASLQIDPGERVIGVFTKVEANGGNILAEVGGKTIISIPLENVTDVIKGNGGMMFGGQEMSTDFEITLNPSTIKVIEEVKEEPTKEETTTEKNEPANKPTDEVADNEFPLFVYKGGTNEISAMANHVKPTVTFTETENNVEVELTFIKGQYLKGFSIEGATIANEKTVEVDGDQHKTFTIEVDYLPAVFAAKVDVAVDEPPVKYAGVYDVTLQIGGVQNPFTDILKAQNYTEIVELYSAGIFKKAEKFNPNNSVKRSQFALMLNRLLELEPKKKSTFKDIASYDKETQTAIAALNEYGIINGKSTTAFDPAKDITRAQAAVIIYRVLEFFEYEPSGVKNQFKDVASNNQEVATAIAELNELGIMTGYEGKFNPNNKLTRNQMAKVFYNALFVLEELVEELE